MSEAIRSVAEYVERVASLDWPKWGTLWFRGQRCDRPLVPKVWRPDHHYNENALVQGFRGRAPALGATPESGRLDKWLFLMQHFGLPTRLLDWTESALVALYFAVRTEDRGPADHWPCVWVLNPIRLNVESDARETFRGSRRSADQWLERLPADFAAMARQGITTGSSDKGPWYRRPLTVPPLTWVPPALDYFRMAFHAPDQRWQRPIAVHPVHDHLRMAAQRSVFTIHGEDRHGIDELYGVANQFLIKIEIEESSVDEIYRHLRLLGVTASTAFPDFAGLATDLAAGHDGLYPDAGPKERV